MDWKSLYYYIRSDLEEFISKHTPGFLRLSTPGYWFPVICEYCYWQGSSEHCISDYFGESFRCPMCYHSEPGGHRDCDPLDVFHPLTWVKHVTVGKWRTRRDERELARWIMKEGEE